MSKDILGMYGKDSPQPKAGVATSGGVMSTKEINYSPPQGPKGIMDGRTVGLHGEVHPCGTQRG